LPGHYSTAGQEKPFLTVPAGKGKKGPTTGTAMKSYDPAKPLIFIHIPRCGGTSLSAILKGWFGDGFLKHYYLQQERKMPVRHKERPGVCIYGHFNRERGFGTDDYYPGATQFATFLRDPLELALSTYFHWKNKRRDIRIRTGRLEPGSHFDYRDLTDYFNKRPRSPLLRFLPADLTLENYRQALEERFIFLGIVGEMQQSVDILSRTLEMPPAKIGHVNKAPRNEEVPPEAAETYRRQNRLEFAVYDYALETHRASLS